MTAELTDQQYREMAEASTTGLVGLVRALVKKQVLTEIEAENVLLLKRGTFEAATAGFERFAQDVREHETVNA